MFLLAVFTAGAGGKRVNLLPKLHSGQTITYLIRYRSDKTVKTESNVVAPMVPNAAQMDAHGLLRIEILDVQQQGAKPVMHARAEFLTLDSGVWLKRPGDKKPEWDRQRVDRAPCRRLESRRKMEVRASGTSCRADCRPELGARLGVRER